MSAAAPAPLIDRFGRRISYVRLSVTDRCDLRCRYCMAETMQFLPRAELLTLDELAEVADAFIARGVDRIRLTGGEPLARGDLPALAARIGRHLGHGLDELTLTTNATKLARHAGALAQAGVRRINVSLDSRDPERFARITRGGRIETVLEGIAAARAHGIAIKINMVALAGENEDEIAPMLRWCAAEGHDLTLIETMPLGETGEDRAAQFVPLDRVREALAAQFTLVPLAQRTGGPARYYQVGGLGARLGLITPLTRNFCAGCNRVRVSAKGELFLCLGHETKVDLRGALRGGGRAGLDAVLDEAMAAKPERHGFDIAAPAPAVARHMSVTGG